MVEDGLSPLRIWRGGRYLRVADPGWSNPLDPSHAQRRGGRWNPPDSFPVLYLNAEIETARANIDRKFVGLPYGPQDLLPGRRPLLVATEVPRAEFVDVITDAGCEAVGLPRTYPSTESGDEISHARCQGIGAEACAAGLPGVACRSAARARGEELAWLTETAPAPVDRWSFDDWYWSRPG